MIVLNVEKCSNHPRCWSERLGADFEAHNRFSGEKPSKSPPKKDTRSWTNLPSKKKAKVCKSAKKKPALPMISYSPPIPRLAVAHCPPPASGGSSPTPGRLRSGWRHSSARSPTGGPPASGRSMKVLGRMGIGEHYSSTHSLS